MELNQLIGGAGASAGTLAGLTLPASGSSAGSVVGSAGSYAAAGASLGSVIPGVGSAAGGIIGGIIGALSGLIGGHGVPGHENADINKIATANDLFFQQAADVCGFKESHDSANFDDICAHAARDNGYFLTILAEYNAAHAGAQITARAVQASAQYASLQLQAQQLVAGTGQKSPLAGLSLQGAQAAAAAQSMSLEDYLKALLDGFVKGGVAGASGAAADTPAGQEATWATIKAEAKKYELVLVAFGLGLIALIYKAFSKK